MILKNQFEVSYEEAILLLENITQSLQKDKSFSFEMKGHEAKVEVEEPLNLSLTISPNRFSVEFLWGDEKDEQEKEPADESDDWRDNFDKDLEDAGIAVDAELEEPSEFHPLIKEVILPEELEVPEIEEQVVVAEESVEYEETYEELTPSVQPPTRALSQKMSLNTSTLSFEGGFWTPAFTIEEINSEWSLVNIDQELDNRRWDPSDEISSPSVKQPTARRAQTGGSPDDDLFSDLDNLGTERSSVVPKTKITKTPLAPTKKAPPKKSSTPDIPAPRTIDIAKKKATIPAPNKASKSIPKPDDQKSGSSGGVEEISEWKEPDREDISSGDDWVKPSEVLQKQKKSPKNLQTDSASKTPPRPLTTKKATSPPPKSIKKAESGPPKTFKKAKSGPPKPPDKKGKKDDKKGWADWS